MDSTGRTREVERRWAHKQALANTRISGHVPTPEFLADCEVVIVGTMIRDEAQARSLARALAMQRKADEECITPGPSDEAEGD